MGEVREGLAGVVGEELSTIAWEKHHDITKRV